MMTQLHKLNNDALDYYLRGGAGELMCSIAQQELYERGQQSATSQTPRHSDYSGQLEEWRHEVRILDKRIIVLEEACRFALSHFEAEWQQVGNHPASHWREYVEVLREALAG